MREAVREAVRKAWHETVLEAAPQDVRMAVR